MTRRDGPRNTFPLLTVMRSRLAARPLRLGQTWPSRHCLRARRLLSAREEEADVVGQLLEFQVGVVGQTRAEEWKPDDGDSPVTDLKPPVPMPQPLPIAPSRGACTES